MCILRLKEQKNVRLAAIRTLSRKYNLHKNTVIKDSRLVLNNEDSINRLEVERLTLRIEIETITAKERGVRNSKCAVLIAQKLDLIAEIEVMINIKKNGSYSTPYLYGDRNTELDKNKSKKKKGSE